MNNTTTRRTRFADLVIILFLAGLAMLGFMMLFGMVCHAQTNDGSAVVPVVTDAATPDWLVTLATKFPWLLYALTVISVARIVFKPLFSLLHRASEEAGWKWFDTWADKAETSKWFATVCYVLDWGASVKLVKK